MQNKIKSLFVLLMALFAPVYVASATDFDFWDDEEVATDDVRMAELESASANAVSNYKVDGSLFQQITDLEQEKVLLQLEKERAQLNLEIDRLAAEKIKLGMEIDTLSGRAEQQAQELETEKAKLEAEAARLERERDALKNQPIDLSQYKPISVATESAKEEEKPEIGKSYRLVNVFGAGNQLQATLENLSNGQSKRISVGGKIDGYSVRSISLDEGVVFVKDGKTETLNVTNGKN